MEKLVVVGEKFIDFANRNKNVLTVSKFEYVVSSGEINNVGKIVIGQGVQLDDILRTIYIIHQHYPEKICDIVNLGDLYYQNNPEHQKSVHKHKKENILITSPEKIDSENYRAKLILQDSSELLCDHQTGQHIQGMVLIEAARQTIISTSEKYLISEANTAITANYFTLTSINVSFSHFVFPLPVAISLRVLSQKKSDYGKFTFECSIAFEQTSIKKAEVCFTFSIYDFNYITQKECEQASICHKDYLINI